MAEKLPCPANPEGEEGIKMLDVEELAAIAVDCGINIHKELGPGLLESVYEAVMAASLVRRGLAVERQKPILIEFDGMELGEGFRADIFVEGQLIIEVKSTDRLAPVHGRQLLTYLRLAKQPLGLLMNFGGETFREGLRRVVNNHTSFATSRLRVNQPSRPRPPGPGR
jgi:GxxExxY protein